MRNSHTLAPAERENRVKEAQWKKEREAYNAEIKRSYNRELRWIEKRSVD